ncbi:MAG: hypothetical protein ABWY06_16800 [Pseudomonas sp.]|uniref:hypothetical protein n=1 Tax=Pseudomonas sp. TaxID=306 RepID=UPI003393B0AB
MPHAHSTSPTLPPVMPLQLSASHVLSQDIIMTATIPVDASSPAPIGVFTNPASGGVGGNAQVEALAIVNHGEGKQLCHIARDLGTDGGWRVIPLFGGRAAEQVAAGVAYARTAQAAVHGLFVDAGQLLATSLAADGSTWSTPVLVAGEAPNNPRVAYSPNGRLVIYGSDAKGDLVTAYQPAIDGPFKTTVCAVQGALGGGDFQLCMTDESTFHLLVNIKGAPYQIFGSLDATANDSLGPVPDFTEKLKQVALGYWNPAQMALTFLLVEDDGALHAWTEGVAGTQKIPGSNVVQATGHVSLDGDGNPLLNLYLIDKHQQLSVLHQSRRTAWNTDGSPRWVPLLALDGNVAHVVSDMNVAAAPSLFALDAGDYSLRLHAQHATSRMWRSETLLQHKVQAYEVVRYRSEIRILDANGRALAHHPVTLSVEKDGSAVDVAAGGRLHQIDETGTVLTTDASGKLTVAVLASGGLVCPNLVVSGTGLTASLEARTVKPSAAIHQYLAGNGTLNPTNPGGPLPTFDAQGGTLAKATLGGKPLAPGASDGELAATAAAAIQQGALVALGHKPAGVQGFGGSLRPGQAFFEVFPDEVALQAHLSRHLQANVGGFWDDLLDFFGDIFEGIKNAVIKIIHFVVDVARGLVNLVLHLAEGVAELLGLPIDGIEKAANFMNGVFNSVDAGIDKVADWLKALFDFKAIWNTKMAVQQGLESLPPYVVKLSVKAQGAIDGWFGQQKSKVSQALDAVKDQYAGHTFGQLPNWQDPCAPASNSPVAGGAAPSDFTDNAHHNWLHDKVSCYAPDTAGHSLDDSIDALWQTVAGHLKDSGEEFRAALEDFRIAIWATLKDPSSFATTAVPALIDMLKELVLAILDLLDALADAVVALVATGFNMLDKIFRAELPLGFLNTLWAWIAKRVGHPEDATLNLYSLSALVVALPTTLIYKLAVGVEHQPFPDGKLALQPASPLALQAPFQMPWQCVLTSDIVRMVQVIPAGASDVLAASCPKWLTAVNLGFSSAVWILRHGYPEQWKEILVGLAVSGPALFAGAIECIEAYQKLESPQANDLVAVCTTLLGVGGLAYGIYSDIEEDSFHKRPGLFSASLLTPLPMIFGFLTLTKIRENPELLPFAIAGNLLFDTVGYVGGGLELMLDTLERKPKTASL